MIALASETGSSIREVEDMSPVEALSYFTALVRYRKPKKKG